jgi:hypothetical protein
MPSKESIRLQWANAFNRKSLPKQIFVCSEICLDGKPTERNPIPQLKLGYEKKTTPGWRKLMRHEPESKKRKLIQEESGAGIYSGDTVSTSSGHKTEYLPEAICEFNVLEPSSVSARKHNTNIPIFWEEMITHTRNQTTFTITLTKILSMDEKGVQVRQYSDRLRLFVVYRGNERDIFYFG